MSTETPIKIEDLKDKLGFAFDTRIHEHSVSPRGYFEPVLTAKGHLKRVRLPLMKKMALDGLDQHTRMAIHEIDERLFTLEELETAIVTMDELAKDRARISSIEEASASISKAFDQVVGELKEARAENLDNSKQIGELVGQVQTQRQALNDLSGIVTGLRDQIVGLEKVVAMALPEK